MRQPDAFVVVHSSEGVIQDIETIISKTGDVIPVIDIIAIDYDDLDPSYDEFTNFEDVYFRVAEILQDIADISPGPVRKRIRLEVTAALRQAINDLPPDEKKAFVANHAYHH